MEGRISVVIGKGSGKQHSSAEVNELVQLFEEILAKTNHQLRHGLRFHVQPSETETSWETVTKHCCLGGCDMEVHTFPAERDALCFAALLQAVGYESPHNFACHACYAENLQGCI